MYNYNNNNNDNNNSNNNYNYNNIGYYIKIITINIINNKYKI